MTGARRHWLVRLYPRAWRDRYGDELSDLIACGRVDRRVVWDVAIGAAREHARAARRKGETIMVTARGNAGVLVRNPSAALPIAMSALALIVVLGNIALFGSARQPDEGAAAHLFQILVVGQVPLIAWFVWRRLRSHQPGTLTILAVQALSVAVALFPVWYFGL